MHARQVAERLPNELAVQAGDARTVGLDTLAYLIGVALLEAELQAAGGLPAGTRPEASGEPNEGVTFDVARGAIRFCGLHKDVLA